MLLGRREFLWGSASLVLASGPGQAEIAEDGFVVLRAQTATLDLLADGKTKTKVWHWAPGEGAAAIVRAKQGQELKLRLVNELDRDIWVHFFGVRGAADVMTLNIPAKEGNSVDCVFTPPDAGTFWFGPFLDASRQRDMGLYGMLIVEETVPVLGFSDVPMVLDDWLLNDAGQIQEDFGSLQAAVGEGRLGNWFTINGALRPRLALDRKQPARLRFLNASNVRSMGVLFKGADPWVMALDGQPVPLRHLGDQALMLAPGQRADVLLEAEGEGVTLALDLFEDIVEIGGLDWTGTATDNQLPDNFALPANPIAKAEVNDTLRRVEIVLAGGAKGGLKSAKVGDQELDTRALLEKGLAWAMNGIAGIGGPPLFSAVKGEAVVLSFDNRTSFPQAMHIHGHVWQLIAEAGKVMEDQPWRDTAILPGSAKAEYLFVADNLGTFVIQSMMAERCDAGLLGSFEVTG
jgi:FtsP/CotA-like multicopper oxidase with cupredoxin domain